MKKIIVIINIIMILTITFSKIAYAENEPIIYSEGAVLIEANTGEVLFDKNANEVLYPASTTKILTAIIALERCDLNEKAVVSQGAISTVPSNYAIADFRVGEEFTIEQLINIMLIHSANDAANVIAEHISGTSEEFVKLMNEKAKEIGCKNSNFVNANGIQNSEHVSTAYDMALIARYCINSDKFNEIIKTENYSLPVSEYCDYERKYKNNNNLINKKDKYYYEYCIGGKTGYTKEAENCLVAISKKDGMTLISVVLKGMNTESGESARNIDSINLFKYGFDNFSLTTLKKKGEKVSSVEIKNSNGNIEKMDVTIENDISFVNSEKTAKIKKIEPEINLSINTTPVKKGEVVGTATYSINGEDYTSNILAAETIIDSKETDNSKQNMNNIIKIVISLMVIILIMRTIKKIKGKNKKSRSITYITKGTVRKTRRRGKGKHSL